MVGNKNLANFKLSILSPKTLCYLFSLVDCRSFIYGLAARQPKADLQEHHLAPGFSGPADVCT